MPITKSAKKRVISSAKKRGFNLARKKKMKELTKGLVKLVSKNEASTAESKLSEAYKAIDKAAKRGVIKKNTAARKKSRLAILINKAKASK